MKIYLIYHNAYSEIYEEKMPPSILEIDWAKNRENEEKIKEGMERFLEYMEDKQK